MSKKNKKKSRNKITSSPSIKPSSESLGKIEDKSREETAFKSKFTNEKTLDVEEQQQMPKSTGFDSNTSGLPVFDSQDDVNNSLLFDSSLPPYDPIANYLSPRPKFLWYKPDRHREILARQQELTSISRSASRDDEMPFLEDELERSVDHSVEKTERIVEESVVNSEEHEDEDEEEEFEDDNRWNLNVFLQYLVVMVALILITLTISSMNSPHFSPTESIHGYNVTEGETFGPMMLMAGYLNDREIDKGYKKRDQNELTVGTEELVEMQHEQTVEMQNEQTEDDEIYFDEYETDEKVPIEWQEPVILVSKKIETYRVEAENEVYIQLLGAADHNSSYANEESEILKPMVDEDDSNKSLNENEGKENTNSVTKLAYFDPVIAAFSAIFFLIFASTSVLYYTMQIEISSSNGHINEVFDESSSVGSFGSRSNIFSEYYESNKDACSSNQTKYFDFQQSTGDSPSHGSFTEKKIVKKQRSKTPKATISTVRRSSRIHNRSISSP